MKIRRRWILLFAQTLLGIGLLATWIWIIDLESVFEIVKGTRVPHLILATSLGMLSTILRSARWRKILRPVIRVPLGDTWLIVMASSLINFLIPIRSGELARGVLLRQRHNASISETLPTVALDRSFDLLTVLVLGTAGLLIGTSQSRGLSTMLILGAALFLAFTSIVVAATVLRERLVCAMERFIPAAVGEMPRDRILGILTALLDGLTSIAQNPRGLAPVLALSLLAGLLDICVLFVIFASLGTIILPITVITGYSLFVLTLIVPSAPGYVGSMEAFGSLVFTALGIQESLAAAAILIFHAMSALTAGIAGSVAIGLLGFRPAAELRSILHGD